MLLWGCLVYDTVALSRMPKWQLPVWTANGLEVVPFAPTGPTAKLMLMQHVAATAVAAAADSLVSNYSPEDFKIVAATQSFSVCMPDLNGSSAVRSGKQVLKSNTCDSCCDCYVHLYWLCGQYLLYIGIHWISHWRGLQSDQKFAQQQTKLTWYMHSVVVLFHWYFIGSNTELAI